MVTLMLISVVLFRIHIFLIADLMSGLRKDIKKKKPSHLDPWSQREMCVHSLVALCFFIKSENASNQKPT